MFRFFFPCWSSYDNKDLKDFIIREARFVIDILSFFHFATFCDPIRISLRRRCETWVSRESFSLQNYSLMILQSFSGKLFHQLESCAENISKAALEFLRMICVIRRSKIDENELRLIEFYSVDVLRAADADLALNIFAVNCNLCCCLMHSFCRSWCKLIDVLLADVPICN